MWLLRGMLYGTLVKAVVGNRCVLVDDEDKRRTSYIWCFVGRIEFFIAALGST